MGLKLNREFYEGIRELISLIRELALGSLGENKTPRTQLSRGTSVDQPSPQILLDEEPKLGQWSRKWPPTLLESCRICRERIRGAPHQLVDQSHGDDIGMHALSWASHVVRLRLRGVPCGHSSSNAEVDGLHQEIA